MILLQGLMDSLTTWHSNLECFLNGVTPIVPSQSLSQECVQDLNNRWRLPGQDKIDYFTLADLWDCYDEWSAYGIGIPVKLDGGENIMQYYVPYLSAIHIYTSKSLATPRTPKEDSDTADPESDCWSDDSENDKLSRSLSNNSSKTWDTISDDLSSDPEGSLSMKNHLGYLYLQHNEMSSPCWRIPLMDKIVELSKNYPALMTLNSVDLSPASWMAVAWYPIYHIPLGRNVKDLSTCFLTYHTLSSSFQDVVVDVDDDGDKRKSSFCREGESKGERSSRVSLHPFGLATYKMQGNLWIKPQTSDHEKMVYLHCAADSWLKQLRADHHDYFFFTSHSTM
ncbi:hypothetical protein CK203_062820 [Vitis vinifera]|uniref:Uncharacterized protein n=1 Tax=Vitis vinifera TaxID=29760 RepID=A0A438GBI4_VITVI|nr:hypothetical protein CK203_062820 [Vitis vinifera]